MTPEEFEYRGLRRRRLALLARERRRDDLRRLVYTFAWVIGFVLFALAINGSLR